MDDEVQDLLLSCAIDMLKVTSAYYGINTLTAILAGLYGIVILITVIHSLITGKPE